MNLHLKWKFRKRFSMIFWGLRVERLSISLICNCGALPACFARLSPEYGLMETGIQLGTLKQVVGV